MTPSSVEPDASHASALWFALRFATRIVRVYNSSPRRKGAYIVIGGFVEKHFRGAQRDCVPCALRAHKRLDHFTLRGRTKDDAPWKLYSLMHNIEELSYAA